MFQKTLIIGLGLIGGSFARALKQTDLSKKIFACDSDLETIDYAKNSGVIDEGFSDLDFLSDELSSFDFIVVATPLAAYDEIFFELKNVNALVIDLGSIKNLDVENLPKNFVPCHPIAGSENAGFEHSDADLFSGKKFVICKENSRVAEVVKKIGAIPEFLEAKKHDEIYALVSHLPQFLSFLTAEFSPKKITNEFFKTAFRLDNSDPEIWSDIFEMNEENLEKFYEKFFDNLERNINGPRNKCGVTSSKREMTSSEHGVTSSKREVTSSEHGVTSSKREVTSSELEVASSEREMTSWECWVKDLRCLLLTNPTLLTNFTLLNNPALSTNFTLLTDPELSTNSALSTCHPALVAGSIDQDFLTQNFAQIFFRVLVAKSLLEIPEIKKFQNYAGSGFRDFTSIVSVLNYDVEKLENLFAQNHKKILKFFNSLQ